MEQALWFFDLVSPFSYLHYHKLGPLREKLAIRAVPVLFAGLLKHWGTKGPAEVIRESDKHWQAAHAIAHNRWQRDRPILSLDKEARRLRAIGSWALTQRETGGTIQVQGA